MEVSTRYFAIGLLAGDKTVLEPTTTILGKIGRIKYVRPLYRSLAKADRQLALDTFGRYRDFYHSICRTMVEKDFDASA